VPVVPGPAAAAVNSSGLKAAAAPPAPATLFEGKLVNLHQGGFDAIIFCLLLSYLPTPALRLECCRQARAALKTHGLLLIITPDSNHVGRGAKRMKAWKVAIESLGFQRCTYEKLQHAHCMAFRAVPVAAATTMSTSQTTPDYSSMLVIPQDTSNGSADKP
jgi:25S rRNA (adenine2142-N1)-methyltransferase